MRSPEEGGRKLPFQMIGPWPGTLLVQPSCSPSAPVTIWSLGIPWTTISLDGSGRFLDARYALVYYFSNWKFGQPMAGVFPKIAAEILVAEILVALTKNTL